MLECDCQRNPCMLRALTGISSVSNGKSLPSTCRSGLALSAGFVSPTGFVLRCTEDNKHQKTWRCCKAACFQTVCGRLVQPQPLRLWIGFGTRLPIWLCKMDFNKQHVHENPNDKIDKETRRWMTDMADHGRIYTNDWKNNWYIYIYILILAYS